MNEEIGGSPDEAVIGALHLALNLLRGAHAAVSGSPDYERALDALERAYIIERKVVLSRESHARIEALEALIAKELRARPLSATARPGSSFTPGSSSGETEESPVPS